MDQNKIQAGLAQQESVAALLYPFFFLSFRLPFRWLECLGVVDSAVYANSSYSRSSMVKYLLSRIEPISDA